MAYDIRVLPLHCVYRPMAEAMNVRLLIPGVRTMSHHESFEASSSSLMVVSIWAISVLTKRESRSPSAWYLTKISNASSLFSLLIK